MLPIRKNGLFELASEADATINRLSQEFDRLVARAQTARTPLAFNGSWANAPLGLWEDQDHIYVELDVPGVKDSDVEIELHQGLLTIRVERKPEEGRGYVFNNRPYGRFERSVSLPSTVDAENVVAKLAHGVLEITLNKRAEAKPRRISVQTD